MRIVEVLGQRLREVEGRLEDVVFRSVPGRVTSLLLRLTEGRAGGEVSLSHQEVADILGVYRETVTNALDRLNEIGTVALGRRRITILKLNLLQDLVEKWGEALQCGARRERDLLKTMRRHSERVRVRVGVGVIEAAALAGGFIYTEGAIRPFGTGGVRCR